MAAPVRLVVVDGRGIDASGRLISNGGTRVWKQRIGFKDIAAAATTGNRDFAFAAPLLTIEGAFFVLLQNFTGGGSTTCTLSAGTTGSAAAYVAAVSVFSGAIKTLPGTTLVPGTFIGGGLPAAAGTLRVQAIADVNTNLLTAGYGDLYVRIRAIGYGKV